MTPSSGRFVGAAGALALVSAEVVLIGVTMLASLGPVERATKANPLDVLRAV
ncbi:MAG TPA: hypothetical protein VG916_12900 [Gemmatimonadaceae bacterium]|nr:hypothetical protein [Gemmatimonadaceae bacterium]